MKLSPAEYLIHVFGGVRATARIVDREPSSVSKWQNYIDKTGSQGGIPRVIHQTILKHAKKNGLDFTADDLVNGRNVPNKKTKN